MKFSEPSEIFHSQWSNQFAYVILSFFCPFVDWLLHNMARYISSLIKINQARFERKKKFFVQILRVENFKRHFIKFSKMFSKKLKGKFVEPENEDMEVFKNSRWFPRVSRIRSTLRIIYGNALIFCILSEIFRIPARVAPLRKLMNPKGCAGARLKTKRLVVLLDILTTCPCPCSYPSPFPSPSPSPSPSLLFLLFTPPLPPFTNRVRWLFWHRSAEESEKQWCKCKFDKLEMHAQKHYPLAHSHV